MGTRYWAFRTDKGNQTLLFEELKAGRLRQGWGYDDSQNLVLIQKEKEKGGNWRERLSDVQKEALPHYRMLGKGDDSMRPGDILLLPNLPQNGLFCLAEVAGSYYFEKLDLSAGQNVWGTQYDYGHVLPVKLLTPAGINKYNNEVHADIRRTLRTVMRMWNIGGCGQHIHTLRNLIAVGRDLSKPASSSARLKTAWENTIAKSREYLHEKLSEELNSKFQAAEWEKPIRQVLENFYPGAKVDLTAGPHEEGADLVVQIPNYFDDGQLWLILIQVKNYTAEIGPGVLGQIELACERYSQDGKILAAVILTTADSESPDFSVKKEKLEKKLGGIPIRLILGERLVELMSEGLSAQIPQRMYFSTSLDP